MITKEGNGRRLGKGTTRIFRYPSRGRGNEKTLEPLPPWDPEVIEKRVGREGLRV